jgi:putative glycosyltransferase
MADPLQTTRPGRAPDLTIVTTMYRSAPFLREFHRRAAAAASGLFSQVEFVFVNDGSPDASLAEALALQREDSRIRIVDLSRNFGHHYAILAGLEYSQGDLVFLLDSDLEEEPECLPAFVAAMQSESADVAFGVQVQRKGGAIERFGGAAAYSLINLLAGDMHLPRNMLLARLMSRRYVDQLIAHREKMVVFAGLASLTGFKQVGVAVTKRSKGSTTYTIARRVKMLVRAVTEFSDRPLHYIAFLGAAILGASILYIAYLGINYIAYQSVPVGYTSLAASVWFLGGLILFSIGIVAIYLSVVFVEVKGRPRFVVRAVYDSMHDASNSLVDKSPNGTQKR